MEVVEITPVFGYKDLFCRKCGSCEIEKIPDDRLKRFKVVCADCGSYIKFEGYPIEVKNDYSLDEQIEGMRKIASKVNGINANTPIPKDRADREAGIMQAVLRTLEMCRV